jgi:hypothetical protein
MHWDDTKETKIHGKTFNVESLYQLSSRGRAAGYELDNRGAGFGVTVWKQIFLISMSSRPFCRHAVSYPMRIVGSFPWGKAPEA